MDQPPITFIVETCKPVNSERPKGISGFQLSKFIRDYSQVLPDRDIYVVFTGECPSLFLDEIEHLLYSKGSKVKVILNPQLIFKLDSKSISTLRRFHTVLIPFHNKYPGNTMEIFLSNLSNIVDKENCSILLNKEDNLSEDKYCALLRVAKKLGFSKISTDFPLNENMIQQCSQNQLHILEISYFFNYNFFIESDGTVRNPKNPNFTSSIYKPVAYMFFSS